MQKFEEMVGNENNETKWEDRDKIPSHSDLHRHLFAYRGKYPFMVPYVVLCFSICLFIYGYHLAEKTGENHVLFCLRFASSVF